MEQKERQQRLVEATVALLEAAPGHRMQITNLNKALFYLDLAALRDVGHTVTAEKYVALKQGPVLDGYKDTLIPMLEHLGLAGQDDVGLGKPVVLKGQLGSFYHMDDYLRVLAAKVASFVASHRATDISDLSHENPGWIVAAERGINSGRAAATINMRVAMQQIIDRDPWLNEHEDAEFLAAINADSHAGVPW
jgi:hypothetical protein